MIFKGMKFRQAPDLFYRKAKKGDTYHTGRDIKTPHLVIVKLSDCKKIDIDVDNHSVRYDATDAKVIADMSGHGLTNMVYGRWKRRGYVKGTLVINNDIGEPVIAHDYYQCTVYLVHDGSVYKASIKRAITEKQSNIVLKSMNR